jgi:hypothetical protein
MLVSIYKHKNGYWGVFKEGATAPMQLFDTELQAYKYASSQGYCVV